MPVRVTFEGPSTFLVIGIEDIDIPEYLEGSGVHDVGVW